MTESTMHLLTGAFAVDAIDAGERRTFLAHLDECDTCSTEVAELMATAARLAMLTERAPPEHVRAAVLSQIERTPQLPPAPADPSSNVVDLDARRRTRRRWVSAGAAALATAAAITAVVVLGGRGDPVGEILAAADAQTFTGVVERGGEATLHVSESQDGGVITFAELPAPEVGSTYQMWLLDDAGQASPEETFEPSDTGSASVLLEGAPDAAAVAVTLEPDAGSNTPTAPILAVIELDA